MGTGGNVSLDSAPRHLSAISRAILVLVPDGISRTCVPVVQALVRLPPLAHARGNHRGDCPELRSHCRRRRKPVISVIMCIQYRLIRRFAVRCSGVILA